MSRFDLFDFRQLEIFLVVCETLNMTRAAEELGMTQSAISYSINGLERTIGERLLDRRHRPIALTPAGHALREAGHQIGVNLQALRSAIENIRSGRLTHFRIGLPGSLSGSFVPALAQALTNHVERLTIRSNLSAEMIRLVDVGELDLAIVFGASDESASFVQRDILSERYVIALPKLLPIVDSVESLRDLSTRLPIIRWSTGQIRRDIETHLKRLNIKAQNTYEVDSLHGVMSMVDEGLGWSVITPMTAYDAWIHARNIQLARFPGADFKRHLIAIYPENRFKDICELCVASARDILENQFKRSIIEMAPWLNGTLIVAGRND